MTDEENCASILGVSIKDVQKIELDILLEFDRICKKHNIKYQLFAGTLIGAIRHKGFIPWDDDIDVCMLREEYDRFLALAEDELGKDYFLQTYRTDPNYMNKFAKIRKNGTVFMEKLVKGTKMHHGFYIDIFAFDNIKADSFGGRYQLWFLRNINSLLKYRVKSRYERLEPGFERSKAKFKYNLIKMLPVSNTKMEDWILSIMTKFNKEETEYVADLANPSKDIVESFMMKRDSITDSIDWDFEGYKFPVPRDYDIVLRRAYGDYMKLPHKGKRVSHHNIVEIDLGGKDFKENKKE